MNNWFAAAAAGVVSLFGGFAGSHASTSHTFNVNDSSSTRKEMHDVHVASSTKTAINISCVASAVSAREDSLNTALTTYTSAIESAYSARSSALVLAYAQSDSNAIRSSVKTAWQQFTSSSQGAKHAWQKSRENAWSTFRNAIKSCGPAASSVADTSNAGSEMSGQ
jgi:hypothetical protein